jgi:signal transduction histidine kinase
MNRLMARNGFARCAFAAVMLALGLCSAPACADPADDASWHVVLLSASDPYLPAFILLDHSVREEISARAGRRVDFYAELLDMLRFPRAQFEQEEVALLRKKYRDLRVDAVVALETTALEFAERHGNEIWPRAAIVFHSVPASYLIRHPLGAHTTGVPIGYEVRPTLDLALRLRPKTRRVVVVGGTADFDRSLQEIARPALANLAGKLAVEYLVDRSLADTVAAVSKLPSDSIVLYLSMFQDGAGARQVPRNALKQIAAASSVPAFGIYETVLDEGIVAGSITSFAAQGRRAGDLAVRVLKGESPAELGVQPPVPPECIADWRQLKRWDIAETLLPEGCEVRFKEFTAWETYRWQILGALAIMLAQMALIAALLLQRRRRQRAELAVQQHRFELAHAGRLATMGELTASIAHEVNQPLGAILANVDAAEMLLETDNVRLDHVREILADIRKDDLRADEVIRRLRTLLAKQEMVHKPVDVNDAGMEVVRLLEAEARRRQVDLVTELDPARPKVLGDRVHLQQVLLNLVVNAMDAMGDTHVSRRRVIVRSALGHDGSVEVAVSDRGHGIAPERLAKLFDSFFTTKDGGMGLGLSIARSIVEAHGGRIWAESDGAGGATFRFVVPATQAARVPSLREEPA